MSFANELCTSSHNGLHHASNVGGNIRLPHNNLLTEQAWGFTCTSCLRTIVLARVMPFIYRPDNSHQAWSVASVEIIRQVRQNFFKNFYKCLSVPLTKRHLTL